MSSGASTAYEKPRSGRSSCIDETPRSSRITSACTPFAASCSSDGRELAVEQPRLDAGARGGSARSTARRSGRGRSRSACRRRAGAREQRGVAAGAERAVDDGLARARVEVRRRPPRRGRGRDRTQLARRSATSSALPSTSCSCWRQSARSQISRWSYTPATVTSRPRPACSISVGGKHEPPLLVELALRGAGEEVPLRIARAVARERVEPPRGARPSCSHASRGPGEAGSRRDRASRRRRPRRLPRSFAGSVRRFFSSSACSCSPSSMVHFGPTLAHFPPPVNPTSGTPRPNPSPGGKRV